METSNRRASRLKKSQSRCATMLTVRFPSTIPATYPPEDKGSNDLESGPIAKIEIWFFNVSPRYIRRNWRPFFCTHDNWAVIKERRLYISAAPFRHSFHELLWSYLFPSMDKVESKSRLRVCCSLTDSSTFVIERS